MSPGGLTGYQDWQRTSQVDTPAFLNDSAAYSGVKLFPAAGTYDVQRFASLGLYIGPTTADITVTLNWYLDPAGTILVAFRTFVVPIGNNAPFAPTRLVITNRAPFVNIQVVPTVGVGAWGWLTRVWGTNRVLDSESRPTTSYLLQNSGVLVGATSSVVLPITEAYAGGAQLMVDPQNGLDFYWYLQHTLPTGGVSNFGARHFTQFAYDQIVLPLGKNFLVLQNPQTGPVSMVVAMTPTLGVGT